MGKSFEENSSASKNIKIENSGEINNLKRTRRSVSGRLVDVDIKDVDFRSTTGQKVDEIYYQDSFTLRLNWDASKHQANLKSGDYFDVALPDTLRFPKDTTARDFDLKNEEGVVIAKAHVTTGPDECGGSVRVTFTEAVENKYNVKGDMYLASRFNKKKVKLGEKNKFEISVGSKVITGEVDIAGPVEIKDEYLAKWGIKVNGNSNQAEWYARINFNGKAVKNVTIEDSIGLGEKFIEDSFELRKGKFDKYGNFDYETSKKVDLSSILSFSEKKDRYTIKLGDLGDGDSYYLNYKTTYTPGTILKNKLRLVSSEQENEFIAQFHAAESGGSGSGENTTRIKIVKVDSEDEKIVLPNAVFEVTRPDGTKFEVKTDEKGEAITDKLKEGEYQIEEKQAPKGYELNREKIRLKLDKSGDVVKKIKNDPIKIDVSVKKKWEGKKLEKVSVKLLRDGKLIRTVELNEANNWSYKFEKLQKFDKKDGHEYKYDVEEVKLENYTSTKEGSVASGFVITNKYNPPKSPPPSSGRPKTRNIRVVKKWKDENNKDLSVDVKKVEVRLYKNGVDTGQKLELNASNNWTGEFNNLEKVDPITQKEHNYTVKEVGEESNVIKIGDDFFKVEYKGSMSDGLLVENTKQVPTKPVPKKPEPKKPEPKKPEPQKPSPKVTDKVLPKTGDGLNPSSLALGMGGFGSLLFSAGAIKKVRRHSKVQKNRKIS